MSFDTRIYKENFSEITYVLKAHALRSKPYKDELP